MTTTDVSDLSFETRQLHAGERIDNDPGARITPIYLSAGFVFEDQEHARQRFAGDVEGYAYSRYRNPTHGVVEDRITSLEGGVAAIAVASGQAALSIALLSLLGVGDHVVAALNIYDGTRTLLTAHLGALGIEVDFVEDVQDQDEWLRLARPTTRALLAESIANPRAEVLDIEHVAAIADELGVPLIVDSTLATPYLLRPLEHGASVVVHSASKFLTGHGASIEGVIVDGGTFDFARHADRYPRIASAPPGTESFLERFGPLAFIEYARSLAASYGPSASPLHSFLLLQGLDTLSLRMERHSANALAVAGFLEGHPAVESVDYGALASSPSHALAQRYLPRGAGGVLSFTLRGGFEAARAFYDRLGLFSRMTHIGDARSYALHPATTTHARLTEEDRARAGIRPGLIRLSVGLEGAQDLIGDLAQALGGAGEA